MLELKQKFFAQYWGQTYSYTNQFGCFNGNLSEDNAIFNFIKYIKNENTFLKLKLISKITTADAVELSEITKANHNQQVFSKMDFDSKENTITAIDFLRSKGYALPFMGYSVEDLVTLGWVQLE